MISTLLYLALPIVISFFLPNIDDHFFLPLPYIDQFFNYLATITNFVLSPLGYVLSLSILSLFIKMVVWFFVLNFFVKFVIKILNYIKG